MRLLVLGAVVRRNIAHGYRIYQDLTSWKADTWTSIKPGSIYHALEKLEAQKLIKAVELKESDVKLGPSRTEFQLTTKGEAEFISLLESALKSNDFHLLAAGIAFMEFLPRKHVIELLEERLVSLKQVDSFLHTLPTEFIPSDPSKHPELIGVWIGYFEYAQTATQKLIQSIKAGKYVFRDE